MILSFEQTETKWTLRQKLFCRLDPLAKQSASEYGFCVFCVWSCLMFGFDSTKIRQRFFSCSCSGLVFFFFAFHVSSLTYCANNTFEKCRPNGDDAIETEYDYPMIKWRADKKCFWATMTFGIIILFHSTMLRSLSWIYLVRFLSLAPRPHHGPTKKVHRME